ncbi:MAG: hypothetical protein CVU06_04775 [Bacteroidetes bacterium HGW-Bacteroidetes-22]|nr:MAG: hypothetical protein CVU06_04775 [Bacteroidetes bacterium HGW-Bacteroidetes-22]
MKLLSSCLVVSFLLMNQLLTAQSVLYSQYRRVDMALNPALTGMTPGAWQAEALWQNRSFGSDTTQNTYLLQGSYRFDFRGVSDKGYGLRIAYEDKYSIAIGVLAELRRATNYREQFTSAYGSVAMQMKTGRNGILSIGAQPGFFMQPSYYPVTTTSAELYNDTIYMPGTPKATKFDVNAGILYGQGKMECWNDDQLYKFQIGLAAGHLTEPWMRDSLPRVPGREIRAHASYLWEINRTWGAIPSLLFQYADEKHLQAGVSMIYRKHFSYLDRIRGALFYQTTGHLTPALGMRFYWGNRATYGLDMEISYDISLHDQQPYGWHSRGFEISLKFGPISRCWSADPCSGAYQHESY